MSPVPPELRDPTARAALVEDIHAALLADDPERGADPAQVLAEVRRAHPLLPSSDALAVASAVTARVAGLGSLEALLADDGVTDVMVNGHGSVWVERDGALHQEPLHLAP